MLNGNGIWIAEMRQYGFTEWEPILQLALSVLICITFALPVSGQNAPVISDIAWGSDECILRALDQDQAFHACYYSGANVKYFPDGHFHLSKPSLTPFKLDVLHGQLSEDDALPEAVFSKFVKIARVCEADVNCDLPQEVSTFWGSDGKCIGRVTSYDLHRFFEFEDVYIKMGSAGSVTVCSSDDGGIWVYQWDGIIMPIMGGDKLITYLVIKDRKNIFLRNFRKVFLWMLPKYLMR